MLSQGGTFETLLVGELIFYQGVHSQSISKIGVRIHFFKYYKSISLFHSHVDTSIILYVLEFQSINIPNINKRMLQNRATLKSTYTAKGLVRVETTCGVFSGCAPKHEVADLGEGCSPADHAAYHCTEN
jgi:hypothetical protein